MSGERLVFYYQVTMGAAHLARVHALDQVPGLRCEGVCIASRELSRAFAVPNAREQRIHVLEQGVFEELPKRRLMRSARSHLDRFRPDAIIIDAPADPIQRCLSRYARRRGCAAFTRWASTNLDHPRHRWKEGLKGFLYRGWDGYLVTGDRAADYLRSFGVRDAKIHRCGNPAEAAIIEARRLAAAPVERDRCFLFVGRFLKLKNLPRFAKAYAEYRAQAGRWGLRIAGFGEDEPELRRLCAGVPGVEFLGHLDFEPLIDQYLANGCLVLPSYSENWGLVVNEAMHAGMPVLLSTRCGCLPDLLDEGRNGFAMDALSIDSMSKALHRIEALSNEDRRSFSQRSLEIIEAHGPEAWAERVAVALESFWSSKGKRAAWAGSMSARSKA